MSMQVNPLYDQLSALLQKAEMLEAIYATTPNVLAENNYVAKGELPKIDQQQLIRLKEESENERVTLNSRSVAHDVGRRFDGHQG